MRFTIGAIARSDINEIMTAVEHDPVGIVEMRRKVVNADEGVEHGCDPS